jgi:hypothetical protein
MPCQVTPDAPSKPLAHPEHAARDLRIEELRRRVIELEAHAEAAFGRSTSWDWWVCVLLAVVVPAVLVWWFAG